MTESQWNDAKGVFNILFLILSAVFLVLYSQSYVEIKHNKARSGITLYVRLVMNTSILLVMAYFVRYIIASTFNYLLTEVGDGATKFETTMKDSHYRAQRVLLGDGASIIFRAQSIQTCTLPNGGDTFGLTLDRYHYKPD